LKIFYLVPLLAVAVSVASVPGFRAPFIIQSNSVAPRANLTGYLDWDEDGITDAVVDWGIPSGRSSGKARIYSYICSNWLHVEPVPISYVQNMEPPAYTLRRTDTNLTVELIANPYMVDWNGDGLNDLIVGQLIDSKVRFYPNVGTNSEPVFGDFTYMQADGADVTATYS